MQNTRQAPVAPGDYLRPDSLKDALAVLQGGDSRIVAGCTDVFPATESRILPGQVLDVTGIAALRGITQTDMGWTIGATTTWSDIARADLPAAFTALQQAAREVGAKQIQNQGTIAGNICNASPAADGVPPLLVLDAEVILQSADAGRSMPLSAFLTGPRQTALKPDELVTGIHIPSTAVQGDSSFLKLGARRYLVISIAMCAARIELSDGIVTKAALAIGACGPVATRLAQAEAALLGHPPDPTLVQDMAVAAALSPIDDMRADAAYRTSAAAELVRRTLAQIGEVAPA